MEAIKTSLVEHNHVLEMQEELRRKLAESQRADIGRIDSIRSTVLAAVVSENYEGAIAQLKAYVSHKSEYPTFQERVERYVQHISELIGAVETKRNFPGLASLSLAKQQEVHEKVIEHFEDLKQYLKQVELVEREQKLQDVRSTIWVLRAMTHAVWMVLLVAFILDTNSGTFGSAVVVAEHYLDILSNYIVSFIKI